MLELASGSGNPSDAIEVEGAPAPHSRRRRLLARFGFVKSIRWQMQAWHAGVLLAVVAAFGGALYYELRRAHLEEIDDELEAGADYLAFWLRGPKREPPKGPPDMRPWREGTPPQFFPDGNRERQTGGRPPGQSGSREGAPGVAPPASPGERKDFVPPLLRRREFRPPGPHSPPERFLIENLELPEGLVRQFPASPPYFAVWRPQGTLLASSAYIPGFSAEELKPAVPQAFARAGAQQRGELREMVVAGPRGYHIVVGRSIARELAELKRLTWLMAATGAGVLAIGLIGDFLISRRVVRPIARISRTAATISADNLGQRIDVTGMESELCSLAQTLNDAFARIEAAFEQQVRFTADASHELRTPLSILSSNAELALRKERTADEYRSFLQTCYQTSKRMQSLVETLLTLARYDSRAIALERRHVSLRRLIDDCIELVAPLAAEKRLHFRIDAPSIEVYLDPVRLSQVIVNLLVNAIAYNREGGDIAVSASCREGALMLAIQDTGRGIPPEEQEHVFERFYRVDKARARATGGHGLGLAICKSIVEAHGGDISLSSAPNEGTTFFIRLPMSEARQLGEISSNDQPSSPATLQLSKATGSPG